MNFKQIRKELKAMGFDREDIKYILIDMNNNEQDFINTNDSYRFTQYIFDMNNEQDFVNTNAYRFIHEDYIDEIMEEELTNDLYTLGCFTDWFIADILDIPIEAVKAIQEKKAYEALGQMLLPHIHKVQQEYLKLDGYGHHFGHYDGNEEQVGPYYVFRIN